MYYVYTSKNIYYHIIVPAIVCIHSTIAIAILEVVEVLYHTIWYSINIFSTTISTLRRTIKNKEESRVLCIRGTINSILLIVHHNSTTT